MEFVFFTGQSGNWTIRANTNTAAETAQRLLRVNSADLRTRLERLASGLRVNRAADDVAALAVSEGLRAQISGTGQGVRNTELAVNQLRTAEGALNETSGILVRMRELAVQASNSTLNDSGRRAIQAEFNQLSAEVNRQAVSASSAFQEGPVATIQAGGGAGEADRLEISVPDASTSALGLDVASLNTGPDAGRAIGSLDQAISSITAARGQLGAIENRLSSSIRVSETARENLLASESTVRDADVAAKAASLARSRTLTQSGLLSLGQANRLPGRVLDLLA